MTDGSGAIEVMGWGILEAEVTDTARFWLTDKLRTHVGDPTEPETNLKI